MLAARETKMLSAERMERMIDAPTNDEAAKILEECGYGDLSGLSAKEAGAALEAHIAALFDEVEGMVPEAQLVQLFRLKYDYHNAKALIKARAMGVECDAILSQRGTVAPQKLLTAFLEEDYRDIPPVLAQAMVSAAAILARTTNPQAADFELDRAYFAQMLALSDGLSDGGFARGYVQLQIDSANLRAAVRTRRMAKDAENARNYSQCDSLLIGDRCGAHTFPYIEVGNRSAVVEHEATTSKIGEDQLFYCNQRGLSTEDAVGLIVNGYAKEVLNKLPMEFAVEAQKLLSISLEGSVG